MFFLLGLLLFNFVFSSEKSSPNQVDWGYEGDLAPAYWGGLSPEFKRCQTGKQQSPIDISKATKGLSGDFNFLYKASQSAVKNNGKTLVVDYERGSFFRLGLKKFELLELHFHVPSEHTLNEKTFPGEIHFVHKGSDGRQLILGVLLRSGRAHPSFDDLLSQAPKRHSGNAALPRTLMNAYNFLPENLSMFHYKGSMTKPPCFEGVQWFIFQSPVEVSESQLKELRSFVTENARPTQLLYDREVRRH